MIPFRFLIFSFFSGILNPLNSIVISRMSDDNSDVATKRRKIETDMFSFEGQRRDYEKKKEELVVEISHAKKEISRLESQVVEQKLAVTNLDHRIEEVSGEISHLKRKVDDL